MPRTSYSDPRYETYTRLPKVAEVEGVDIHCDGADGSFWAKVGRGVVTRRNLAELKRMISRRVRPVMLLSIGDTNGHFGDQPAISTIEIVGVEKVNRDRYGDSQYSYRRADGELIESFRVHLYAFDLDTLAKFKALQGEMAERKRQWDDYRDEWRGRWNALREPLERLKPDQVKALRDKALDQETEADGMVSFTAEPEDPSGDSQKTT